MQYIWDAILKAAGSLVALLAVVSIALVAVSTGYSVIQKIPSVTFLLLLLIPLLAIILYQLRKKRKLRDVQKIRNEWGQKQLEKERKLEIIRSLFDFSSTHEENKVYIDDQTWKDLNLDQLYARIDRTLTDPGESVLYKMLREPLLRIQY